MDENQEDISPEQIEQQEALIQEEQDIRLQVAAEQANLVGHLDEAELKRIAKEVVENTKEDLQSRKEWEEKQAFYTRLYYQTDYENTGNMQWAACESLPILTEACNMFATRTGKAFFSKPEFVGAKVTQFRRGQKLKELRERAERVARHMNWQLTAKMRNYRSDKSSLFLATAIHGSYFTKTYFDTAKRQSCVDNVSAMDLVVPYAVGPVSIEDLPRKTEILRVSMQKCREWVESGYLSEQPKAASDLELDAEKMAYQEAEGIQQSMPLSKPNENNGMALLFMQFMWQKIDDAWKPYIAIVDKTSCKLLRLAINYEATPTGQPLNEDEPYKPIEYYTHYKFLDNPDGFYGYGYGHLLGDINAAVNIMLRNSMDAATLQNEGNCSGFVSADIASDTEEVQMEIGRFKKLDAPVANIRDKIYTMDFKGPSTALVQLMQLLDARGQRLGAVTEATTGSSDKVQQPTTVITQVEQAMELLTSVQLGISRSISDELQKLYDLNRKYMPAVDYYITNDEPETVAISDYSEDMLVEVVFDPRFSSTAQKVALATAELQAVTANPLSQTRPQVYDLAYKNYLEALGSDRVDEYFPEPPPPQNINDQEIENGYFLLPEGMRPPFDVFADQDHALHLTQLQTFLAQYASYLDEATLAACADHQRKHLAFNYIRENAGQTDALPAPAWSYPDAVPPMNPIDMSMFGNPNSAAMQEAEGGP